MTPDNSNNSPYLDRYHSHHRKKVAWSTLNKWLEFNCYNRHAAKKFPPHLPKVIFQNNLQHAELVADSIAAGWPVIMDYGATYGTAFNPDIRNHIAVTRREKAPLACVSLVSTYADAIKNLDRTRTHPVFLKHIDNRRLQILTENITFVRFPLAPDQFANIHPCAINENREVQFWFSDEADPILNFLKTKHGLNYYAVRSSNLTGKPEEHTAIGALKYAVDISAPLIALRHKDILTTQHHRQRTHSQPIIRLPHTGEKPEIKLKRIGNTHPEALKSLFKELGNIIAEEEKTGADWRQAFNPIPGLTVVNPQNIKQALLAASGF